MSCTSREEADVEAVFGYIKAYSAEYVAWYKPISNRSYALLFLAFSLQSMVCILKATFIKRPHYYSWNCLPLSHDNQWFLLTFRKEVFYPFLLAFAQVLIVCLKLKGFFGTQLPSQLILSWGFVYGSFMGGHMILMPSFISFLLAQIIALMALYAVGSVPLLIRKARVCCSGYEQVQQDAVQEENTADAETIAEPKDAETFAETIAKIKNRFIFDIMFFLTFFLLFLAYPLALDHFCHGWTQDTYLCPHARFSFWDFRSHFSSSSGSSFGGSSPFNFLLTWAICLIPVVIFLRCSPQSALLSPLHPAVPIWRWMDGQVNYSTAQKLELLLRGKDKDWEDYLEDMTYLTNQIPDEQVPGII